VLFTNDIGNALGVTLYHPDTGAAFQSWTVGSGVTEQFHVNVENDWGVQLGQGEIKQLARCAHFSNGIWSFSATQFVNA
jgi:hypothetical protein